MLWNWSGVSVLFRPFFWNIKVLFHWYFLKRNQWVLFGLVATFRQYLFVLIVFEISALSWKFVRGRKNVCFSVFLVLINRQYELVFNAFKQQRIGFTSSVVNVRILSHRGLFFDRNQVLLVMLMIVHDKMVQKCRVLLDKFAQKDDRFQVKDFWFLHFFGRLLLRLPALRMQMRLGKLLFFLFLVFLLLLFFFIVFVRVFDESELNGQRKVSNWDKNDLFYWMGTLSTRFL